MAEPFYGVDGNLLVEDLPFNDETVEKILNGTFKAEFWAQQFLPITQWTRYPQLADEYRKREHRSAYHAKFEQLKKIYKEKRRLSGR
jgi:hypothetical protein